MWLVGTTGVSHLSDMQTVVVREFVRAFPRFVAKARHGEVIEVRHRDGATFTFALKAAAKVQPRRAARPLDPKLFARFDLDAPAFPPLAADARLD